MIDALKTARGPLIGGVLVSLLALATLWITGEVTGGEARYQLEATQPTVRFLCATVVTAAATVLALMVTALSLANARDEPVNQDYFLQLRLIAFLCSAALIGGVAMLMILTVPFAESLEVAGSTYATVYYLVIGGSALLGGLMVLIVLLLHATLRNILSYVRPAEEADEA